MNLNTILTNIVITDSYMTDTSKGRILKTALERPSSDRPAPLGKKHPWGCGELFAKSFCEKEQKFKCPHAVGKPQLQLKWASVFLPPSSVWVYQTEAWSSPFLQPQGEGAVDHMCSCSLGEQPTFVS